MSFMHQQVEAEIQKKLDEQDWKPQNKQKQLLQSNEEAAPKKIQLYPFEGKKSILPPVGVEEAT